MTDINVVKQIRDLRRDLDMEVNLFHEQIELPLDEALMEDKQFSEQKKFGRNSAHLSSCRLAPFNQGTGNTSHDQ